MKDVQNIWYQNLWNLPHYKLQNMSHMKREQLMEVLDAEAGIS